jgi:type IV pilus assembly protein PilN
MARINLLPWREEHREERQKEFYMMIVFGLIVSSTILYVAIAYVDGLLSEQKQRNAFMTKEIAVLDVRIKEIKDLDTERAKLLARMEVIQSLQASRPKVVKDFESIVKTVPEGIHLNKVTRKGKTLTIDGVAQSNARVSVFMRQLDNDPEFDEATLNVVQRSSSRDDAIRSFTLSVPEFTKPREGEQ